MERLVSPELIGVSWGEAAGTQTLRLKVCHGAEEWAGSGGGGGSGFTLTAEHMEGCRFSSCQHT